MTLPSSNVLLVQSSADRLSVLVPPFYEFSLALFVTAGLLVILVYGARRTPLFVRLQLWLLCLGGWLGAFYLSSSSVLMVLSRTYDSLSITHRAFGFEISSRAYPLHDVAGFGLYTSTSSKGGGVSHDVSVLLKSGREFGLVGATTNQRGYQSAVDALNDFLRERSPVQ